MKNGVIVLLCALLSVYSISLQAETIKGNGKIVTKQIDVSDFYEIALSVPAVVNFTQGDEYSCSITTDENILPFIGFKGANGTLRIRQLPSKDGKPLLSFSIGEKEINLPQYKFPTLEFTSLVINISAPRLEAVRVSGSGTFNMVDDFFDAKLDVSVNGSGQFNAVKQVKVSKVDVSVMGSGSVKLADVKVREAEVSLSGSGNVLLNGTYTDLDLKMGGSGDIKTYGDALRAKAKIAGSGSIFMGKIAQTIKYDIAGSGSIYYSGTPELSGLVAGSGSIQQKESTPYISED